MRTPDRAGTPWAGLLAWFSHSAAPWGASWPALTQLEQAMGSDAGLALGGALCFGVATGVARERAESVAASVMLHWAALAAWLGLTLWFP